MLALGSDHVGSELKQIIIPWLEEQGYAYKDFGAFSATESSHYPVYGQLAARAVAAGECRRGLLFCGTGVGISIAANKVKGIRCVNCTEPYSALMSREHNDANMLALGARVVGSELAKMIIKTWLEGQFLGGRHGLRVQMIADIEDGKKI